MNIAAGKIAEQAAVVYLQQHGLRIIKQNYACRHGEIDIIAEDNNTLVFVEVRQRQRFLDAAESIIAAKQQRLITAASHYLSNDNEQLCRFDAILIDGNGDIVWLRHAFDANQ